jgi:hypothetical protein
MRLLARGVSHIVDAERKSGITLADTGSDVTLSGLARDVAHARIDLIHFRLVYYFTSSDAKARVASWVHDLVRIAHDGGQPGRPAHVRFAASVLDQALDEFAALVNQRFLHIASDDKHAIFDALAKDQMAEG